MIAEWIGCVPNAAVTGNRMASRTMIVGRGV